MFLQVIGNVTNAGYLGVSIIFDNNGINRQVMLRTWLDTSYVMNALIHVDTILFDTKFPEDNN